MVVVVCVVVVVVRWCPPSPLPHLPGAEGPPPGGDALALGSPRPPRGRAPYLEPGGERRVGELDEELGDQPHRAPRASFAPPRGVRPPAHRLSRSRPEPGSSSALGRPAREGREGASRGPEGPGPGPDPSNPLCFFPPCFSAPALPPRGVRPSPAAQGADRVELCLGVVSFLFHTRWQREPKKGAQRGSWDGAEVPGTPPHGTPAAVNSANSPRNRTALTAPRRERGDSGEAGNLNLKKGGRQRDRRRSEVPGDSWDAPLGPPAAVNSAKFTAQSQRERGLRPG